MINFSASGILTFSLKMIIGKKSNYVIRRRGEIKFSIFGLRQFLKVVQFLGWDDTFFDIHS